MKTLTKRAKKKPESKSPTTDSDSEPRLKIRKGFTNAIESLTILILINVKPFRRTKSMSDDDIEREQKKLMEEKERIRRSELEIKRDHEKAVGILADLKLREAELADREWRVTTMEKRHAIKEQEKWLDFQAENDSYTARINDIRTATRDATNDFMERNHDFFPQQSPYHELERIIENDEYLKGNHYGLTSGEAKKLGRTQNQLVNPLLI